MAEQAFPATPQSFGAARVVATPFQFALTEDDNLQIVSANSLAGVVLAIQGRRLTTGGKIEPFAFSHTPNSDRSSKTQNFQLGAGALLNLTIFASSGAPVIGQTYASVRMIRGLSAATILLGGLLGGYVTAAQPLAYPGSPIISSIEGGGYTRHITGTDPPAGSNISETVPTGARWFLRSIQARLVTDANVSTRTPLFDMVAPISGNFICFSYSAASQTAGTTNDHAWALALNGASAPASGKGVAGLPDLRLKAGSLVRLELLNGQAGDNWGAPELDVEEWLEVA